MQGHAKFASGGGHGTEHFVVTHCFVISLFGNFSMFKVSVTVSTVMQLSDLSPLFSVESVEIDAVDSPAIVSDPELLVLKEAELEAGLLSSIDVTGTEMK